MNSELRHHGVLGMHWGIRRYQPYPKGERVKGGKEIGEATKVQQRSEKQQKKINTYSSKYKLNERKASKAYDEASELARSAKALRNELALTKKIERTNKRRANQLETAASKTYELANKYSKKVNKYANKLQKNGEEAKTNPSYAKKMQETGDMFVKKSAGKIAGERFVKIGANTVGIAIQTLAGCPIVYYSNYHVGKYKVK